MDIGWVVFLGELKDEVKLNMRILKPPTLVVAYGLARMHEKNLSVVRRCMRFNVSLTSGKWSSKVQTKGDVWRQM
jgi:hypothetical protein